MAPVTVLYEDAVCIVVVKPPGMASQTERSSAPDMVSWLKNYLSRKQKGKEPYVGVVHRLDRPVGGVMVYALTKAAAADLSGQIRQNLMQKSYLAVLKGRPAQTEGSCTDWLKKDGKTNTSSVVPENTPEAKKAVLKYRVLETRSLPEGELSLVRVALVTGRHHQIRVQMAHQGTPLMGDLRYGPGAAAGRQREMPALFAAELSFRHPVTGRVMHFEAPPSESITRYFPQEADQHE